MKKILSVIIILITLSLLLSLPVYADSSLKISDDYKYVYYQGEKYVKVDGDAYMRYDQPFDFVTLRHSDFSLTSVQEDEIETISGERYKSVIEVSIGFRSGGHAFYTYIDASYLLAYNSLIKGKAENLQFTLQNVDLNSATINTTKSSLCGSKKTLDAQEIDKYRSCVVRGTDDNGLFYCDYGTLLIDMREGRYFYLDGFLYQTNPDKVTVWVVTDEELIETLDEVLFGSEADVDDSDTAWIFGLVLTAFLFVIFVGIPVVGTVLGFIFSARSRSPYKLIWRILALLFILCLVLIISMVLIAILG